MNLYSKINQGVPMTKEDDLFHLEIEALQPKLRDGCPICDQIWNSHNYHDFVSCLEKAYQVTSILRHGRNGY